MFSYTKNKHLIVFVLKNFKIVVVLKNFEDDNKNMIFNYNNLYNTYLIIIIQELRFFDNATQN
jgi:hypothetical protein